MKKLATLFTLAALLTVGSAYGVAVAITTTNAPPTGTNTSQGIILPANHDLIYTSQILPKDPITNQIVNGDASVQMNQCLDNLSAILVAGGSSLSNLLRVNIYLDDLSADQNKVRTVWQGRLTTLPYSTRIQVQSNKLPQDALVAIDAVAYIEPAP